MITSNQLTLPLFEDAIPIAPETEGIKYAGSKLKLIPYILQMAQMTQSKTVFDGFSGTTRVAQSFAQSGYQVISNDVSAWSYTFGTCYLLNPYPKKYFLELIDHLNALQGKDGWFTEHYGGDALGSTYSSYGDTFKKPWQKHNTMKLDAIREEIERLNLDQYEKSVVLTSLILAMDEVDSTLGHYASYLNEWSPRSYHSIRLRIPRLINHCNEHQVYQNDIFECLPHVDADLSYYDPPYGSNNEKMPPSRVRYQAYYHIWTSICLYDKPPIFGKAKRRLDTSDSVSASVFEEFRKNPEGKYIALQAIEQLLYQTNTPFIILSYSSGGRATANELHQIINDVGKLRKVVEIDYKRHVMGNMRWTNQWIKEAEMPNKEFLFLIEK